jgi:hypothetical protein
MLQKFQLVIRTKLVSTLALNGMRLTGHGSYCWQVSTKVSTDAMPY